MRLLSHIGMSWGKKYTGMTNDGFTVTVTPVFSNCRVFAYYLTCTYPNHNLPQYEPYHRSMAPVKDELSMLVYRVFGPDAPRLRWSGETTYPEHSTP